MKTADRRSRYEARIGNMLPAGTKYEPKKFWFHVAEPRYRCRGCGSKEIERKTSYTPDYLLPNGHWIEVKGRFTGGNRRNMLAWKAAYPEETLYIMFMVNQPLSKGAKSKYGEWADKAGFKWSTGTNIPKEWLR